MNAATDLVPPRLRAALAQVRLDARLSPPAGPLGLVASRQRGQGLEFSQYRAYEPGDEPRRIDWKLYARSDRHFVREADSEAALTLWILLDATASMQQADLDTPGRSKIGVARTLAAAAVEVALRQGDRFGLVVVRDGTVDWTPAGQGARHRDRCQLALLRAACAGTWPGASALRTVWQHIAPAAVVLFLGDGFDATATDTALRLAQSRRDVRSIALTGVDERDFALRGGFVFEDPETGARLDADAAHVRHGFRERFVAARAQLARELAAAGVRHAEHVLDDAPEQVLRHVLGAGR